jgi:hypothetical protein
VVLIKGTAHSQFRLLNFLFLPLALSYSSADGEPKREENGLTVGTVMACLMLEVAEELRGLPF